MLPIALFTLLLFHTYCADEPSYSSSEDGALSLQRRSYWRAGDPPSSEAMLSALVAESLETGSILHFSFSSQGFKFSRVF